MSARPGFAEFVAARYLALIRTAWLLTGDHGRAEDLVQEALVRCWRVWPQIELDDRPEVYVRKVMVNLNISWWRRRWRNEMPSEVIPEPACRVDLTAACDLRELVRQALAVLPTRQRAVIVLRYFDDLTEAQTATVLGCSVGTVKSQTSRAMARLRTGPLLSELRDLSLIRDAAGGRPVAGDQA